MRIPWDRAALLLYAILSMFVLLIAPMVPEIAIPDRGSSISVVGNILCGALVLGVGIPLIRTWRRRSLTGRVGLVFATAIYVLTWTLAWSVTWWRLLMPYHSGGTTWGL